MLGLEHAHKDWSVTLEDIYPQKKEKYAELERIVGMMYNAKGKCLPYKEIRKTIAPLLKKELKKQFGLQFKIKLNDIHDISTMPFYINDRSVLAYDSLRKYVEKNGKQNLKAGRMQKHLKKNIGIVDPKNAKVGGVFSLESSELNLDPAWMINSKGVTASELTAIMFHEVGHVYDSLATSHRTASFNASIEHAMSRVDSSDINTSFDTDKFTVMFKELKKNNVLDKKQISKLKESNDRVTFGFNLSMQIIKSAESVVGGMLVDSRQSERLADSFSTRCGYGLEIATGLNKISNGRLEVIGSIIMGYGFIISLYESLVLLNGAVLALLGGILSMFFIFIGLALFKMLIVYGSYSMSKHGADSYGQGTDRFNSLLNSNIAVLNESDFYSVKDKRAMVNNIEFIKELIDKQSNIPGKLTSIIQRIVDGHDVRKRELVEAIDMLANNQLHLAAADIETLHLEFET